MDGGGVLVEGGGDEDELDELELELEDELDDELVVTATLLLMDALHWAMKRGFVI